MYRVYCDGQLLYHTKLESLQIFKASLELEVNKTGSFQFVIYPDHPRYGQIAKLKSIITVYQDDWLLFRGRVLEDETGWHNEKTITCEGDTAFLLDSVLRPFAFSGTPAEFLAYVLSLHNAQVEPSKAYQAGTVTVEGYIAHDTKEYATTKAKCSCTHIINGEAHCLSLICTNLKNNTFATSSNAIFFLTKKCICITKSLTTS